MALRTVNGGGWTVENLIDMLEKAGFTYEFGKDIEYLT